MDGLLQEQFEAEIQKELDAANLEIEEVLGDRVLFLPFFISSFAVKTCSSYCKFHSLGSRSTCEVQMWGNRCNWTCK
jgi:hypothetical protein